jgi:hypothetical protein
LIVILGNFTLKNGMLNHKFVKSERQWKSVVGVSSLQFHKLCKEFGVSFEQIYQLNIQELSLNLRTDFLLPTYEDCLFFVLFQLKNGLSYDSLGLLIGTDGGNAHINFEKYLTVLESSIRMDKMPKREFNNLAEFEIYFKENKDIILDATEHPTQRPKGYNAQKELYSGKKRLTPIKNS